MSAPGLSSEVSTAFDINEVVSYMCSFSVSVSQSLQILRRSHLAVECVVDGTVAGNIAPLLSDCLDLTPSQRPTGST